MTRLLPVAVVALLSVSVPSARADDLTRSNRFVCAAARATTCVEDDECVAGLPWKRDVPELIE